jgi:hypothetical protein
MLAGPILMSAFVTLAAGAAAQGLGGDDRDGPLSDPGVGVESLSPEPEAGPEGALSGDRRDDAPGVSPDDLPGEGPRGAARGAHAARTG